MLAHGSDIVSNLLEIATTCDGTTDHTPSMKDQVTELAKVKLEDHHLKYHLYKVLACVRACVVIGLLYYIITCICKILPENIIYTVEPFLLSSPN